MWVYPVTLVADDNRTVMASVPGVPGVHSFGADNAEALVRVEDALLTMLMALVGAREPIPRPRRARRGPAVTLPHLVSLKLELYLAMRKGGVGKAELGRRLKVHLPQVDRLIDLGRASRLDSVVAALRAVGREVEVRVKVAHRTAA